MTFIPVLCYSCNKVIANKYKDYTQNLTKALQKVELDRQNGLYKNIDDIQKDMALASKNVLDSLGITRMCCRRMFIAQPDIVNNIVQY